jgi:hypothetical protein
MISHNNQPNYRGRDGGGIGEDARPSGNAGGAHSIVLGPVKFGGGEIYNNIKALIKLIIFLAVLRS